MICVYTTSLVHRKTRRSRNTIKLVHKVYSNNFSASVMFLSNDLVEQIIEYESTVSIFSENDTNDSIA